MRITGSLRVDLTAFVNDVYLVCGDAESHAVYGALRAAAVDHVIFDIGPARHVDFMDGRIAEALQESEVQSVEFSGTDVGGISRAVRSLSMHFLPRPTPPSGGEKLRGVPRERREAVS